MKTPTIRIQKFTGLVRQRATADRPAYQWKAYYWRLVAANGEKLAVSEAFTRAASRNKTIALLLRAKLVVV